jgi:hypothetical protein
LITGTVGPEPENLVKKVSENLAEKGDVLHPAAAELEFMGTHSLEMPLR